MELLGYRTAKIEPYINAMGSHWIVVLSSKYSYRFMILLNRYTEIYDEL